MGAEAGAACSVAGAWGAAAWASAEPERATPAVNREAIANLRIMMSEPRTWTPRTRPEPGNSGGATPRQLQSAIVPALNEAGYSQQPFAFRKSLRK
jgi:hypothetical protein